MFLNKIYLLALFCGIQLVSTCQGEVPCKDDSTCEYFLAGSSCDPETKVCKCPEDEFESSDRTKCLSQVAGYGAECEDNLQCSNVLQPGGVCVSSACECAQGYHYLQGQCWKSVGLGESCFQSQQCYASHDYIGLTCKDDKCQCRDEYYQRGNGCRRKQNVGETCVVNADCNCPNGLCTSFACSCPSDTNSKHNSESKSKEDLNERKFTKAQTLTEETCELGYLPINGTCYPELGTECVPNSGSNDCEKVEGVCLAQGACGCDDVRRIHSVNNQNCVKVAAVFNLTACKLDYECVVFDLSVCDPTTKKCLCMEGTRFDADNTICKKSSALGEDCDEDDDCVTASGNVACQTNKCACVTGSHSVGNDCRKDAIHLGDTCVETIDCFLANTNCSSNICTCSENYFESDGACVQGIGSSCASEEDCQSISNSICAHSNTSGVCQCAENFVPSTDISNCLPLAAVGESCVQTSQCPPSLGEYKECNEGICGCQDAATLFADKCYLRHGLGEKCTARAECIYPGDNPDAYMCQNSICACQYGYHKNGEHCV